jgi:cyclic pyranopterin phosphate synthase
LSDLAAQIAAMPGLQDLSLSTNATQLAKHAQALKAAGVNRLNISLDTLNPQCFTHITGRDALPHVLEGLAAAQAAGFSPIKLNMVVQSGVNLGEVDTMVAFALERDLMLRLIEPMPVGDTGRSAAQAGVNLSQLGLSLAERFGLVPQVLGQGAGPARYWVSADGRMSLGVITPMSQHFCDTCNRVRLGVDGTLYLCLGQNDRAPLGQLMRQGASDADLIAAIHEALARKPRQHHFTTEPQKIVRFMSQTGG